MEDISGLAPLATSTPETAVKNIGLGNMFGTDPRFVGQNQETFDKKASVLLKPTEAEPPIADYMRQSSEHAAAATPDVEPLNWMARQKMRIADYVFGRPTVHQEIVELNLKKINQGGKLDSNDELKLLDFNDQARNLETKDYGFSSPVEEAPFWIANKIVDFGQSAVRGARKGLFENDALSVAMRTVSPTLGVVYGLNVKDPFDTLTAGTYNELGNLTDDQGNPKDLSHEDKLNISRGVGVVGTTLMNAVGVATMRLNPFMKSFANPSLIGKIIDTPAKAAAMSAIGNMTKVSLLTGGATAITEISKIIGEEIALNSGTDEAGFWNAIESARGKLEKYAPRVGKAGAEGMAMGALFQAPFEAVGFGRTKQMFSDVMQPRPQEPLLLTGGPKQLPEPPTPLWKDVTPPGGPKPKGPAALGGEKVNNVIDITDRANRVDTAFEQIDKAFKSLEFNEAMHSINDVQKITGLNELSPTELSQVNKRSFDMAGIKKVYTGLKDMQLFASDPVKAEKARSLIPGWKEGTGQLGEVIEVEPHKVMEIAKEYPEILDHVTYDPEAKTPLQAKELVESYMKADKARSETMTKLGVKEPSPKVEALLKDIRQGQMDDLFGKSKEEQPKVNPDFEGKAQRTAELLQQKQQLETEIAVWEKQKSEREENFNEWMDLQGKDPSKVVDINSKAMAKKVSEYIAETEKDFEKRKKAIDKELEKLKAEVTKVTEEQKPGDLLLYPFDAEEKAIEAEYKFGHEPTFSDALRTVLPEKQVAAFDEAVLRARQNTVDMVHDQAVHEMNKVVDQTVAMAQEEQFRMELDKIANNPNFATVDKFYMHQIANTKGKAKRSMYAIDPDTLPDDLRHFYESPKKPKQGEIKNPSATADAIYPSETLGSQVNLAEAQRQRLKDHKVFAKGGMTADESAQMLGYANGRELLEVLANTPTREEVAKARAAAYDSDIEKMVMESADLDNLSIMKAFTDKTKAYVETLKFMKDQDWSKTKFGIKTIALPLPQVEDIENDAKELVKKLTIAELVPSKFAVGERQSYKEAVTKFLKGDIAGAFAAKEKAARNSAIRKEVIKAIAATNRAKRFARRLEDPAAKSVMRNAGPTARNAMNEILDYYNLNPNKKNTAKLDSFAKWVKKLVDQGRGDHHIPEHLTDVRQSIDEMTVEQVLVAEDRLRAIFVEAQYKSELLKSKAQRDSARNIDRIALEVEKVAANHNGGGRGGKESSQDNLFLGEYIHDLIGDFSTAFTNMEHILRYFDNGQLNGIMQQIFMHPLKGDGIWHDRTGVSKFFKMLEHLAKRTREIQKNHGNFENLERDVIYIDELKDFKDLRSGWLTRADLMVLWAYMGDPGGRSYMVNNFKNSEGKAILTATWHKIFDEHLEERDVTAMQYAVDMFKEYQEETKDLQLRDKGEQVEFVKGVPNKWKDKWFPGGYVKLNFKSDWDRENTVQALKDIEAAKADYFSGKVDASKLAIQYAAMQTRQNRLKQRTGGANDPLDLSMIRFFRAHEEVLYDLSFREPVKNILKLLKDKRIKAAIIKMGGKQSYNLMRSTVVEMAGQMQVDNANYFSDQIRPLKDLMKYLQNNFDSAVLSWNLKTTTPIQLASTTQVLHNMGASGVKHLFLINQKMIKNYDLIPEFARIANEIDPTIGHFKDQIQNRVESMIMKLIPQKDWKNNVPMMTKLSRMNQELIDKGMTPMAFVDMVLKVQTALASYSQFMAGDSPNYPMERIQEMSPRDKHEAAVAYARQVSRLSLTHGRLEDKMAFQKNPYTQFLSNYQNDARNVLNNIFNFSYRFKWMAGDILDERGAGYKMGEGIGVGGGGGGDGGEPPSTGGTAPEPFDFNKRKRELEQAPRKAAVASLFVMGFFANMVFLRWWEDKLRGIQETPDQWIPHIDWKTEKGRKAAMKKAGDYIMSSPPSMFLSVYGLTKDINFAAEMPDKVVRGKVDKTKQVNVPFGKEATDIATGASTISDAFRESRSASEFLWYLTNLDNKETKSLLYAQSFLFTGAPVNAYTHLMKLLNLPLNRPNQIPEAVYDKLAKNAKAVVKKFGEGADIAKREAEGLINLDPKFVADVDQLQKDIQPQVAQVPIEAADKIKIAMSGGDWSKPDGIYGFTEEQWNDIKVSDPKLGLTTSGRTSKNTEQQEKAMDFMLHYNAMKLAEADIKVTNESLYGAHRFGLEEYTKLSKATGNEKVKDVLSPETLKKNPDLANIKTVAQLRAKLANDLNKGNEPIPGSETVQLTEPTPSVED